MASTSEVGVPHSHQVGGSGKRKKETSQGFGSALVVCVIIQSKCTEMKEMLIVKVRHKYHRRINTNSAGPEHECLAPWGVGGGEWDNGRTCAHRSTLLSIAWGPSQFLPGTKAVYKQKLFHPQQTVALELKSEQLAPRVHAHSMATNQSGLRN